MPPKSDIQNNLISHLVSSLGPNKTGSYSPFGDSMMSVNVTQQHQQQSPVTPNSNNNSSNANVKKPRIVAEVKPMRMSYSDVLSKTANEENQNAQQNAANNNSTSSSPNTTLPIKKVDKKFPNASNFEKKITEGDKENGIAAPKAKKSALNSLLTNSGSSDGKKSSLNGSKSENGGKSSSGTQGTRKKGTRGQSNAAGSMENGKRNLTLDSQRNSQKNDSDDTDDDENSSSENESDDDEDIPMEYYNVRKNIHDNGGQHHNIEKITGVVNKPQLSASVSYKKSKATTSSTLINRSQTKPEKTQKRTVKTSTSSRKRQKHEVLLKLCVSWFNYLLKFLQWLWTLILDVGYLSCGIIWDRLNLGYQYVRQLALGLRQELKSTSGRPSLLWLKNAWKRFDGRFEKKSRWAFWRYSFWKKKTIASEQVKDYYKDGRLPKTAEEAMSSLLNCKGKDAYSILGVSPNCSQEQIRKHYKKIAVLVHPDKNKQAGAEEAFKVLQRSFELIGEPESRNKYDQSMAEALNAEKAWSELNDLLVQLQTKISEAANTIRCSSCIGRHPRKPTGRKPFAARECSTCKIRHPAREGDIWAETAMMGFRWKYLALMEGHVYDITEWAMCQKGALSHLQANSCVVQYKIVLGGNTQQQQQQQQQNHHQPGNGANEREKFHKKDANASEPSLDDFFLNNIYAGQTQQHQQRRRFKK
ncbi:unnamed protein product [Diamesa tonsa]